AVLVLVARVDEPRHRHPRVAVPVPGVEIAERDDVAVAGGAGGGGGGGGDGVVVGRGGREAGRGPGGARGAAVGGPRGVARGRRGQGARRRRLRRRGRGSSRGARDLRGELPLAVLEDHAHVRGFDLVALLALDLQGGAVARNLGRLDLELGSGDLALHLLALLVGGAAELRRHHALVHERVAVDELVDVVFGERVLVALEGLFGRGELGTRGRQLEGDRFDLGGRQLDLLAVGGLDGEGAVVVVDDLAR